METCRCGQYLLVPNKGRHAARLLDCLCGHDHFDALAALSAPADWPADDVHCAHETYQREIDTFRNHAGRPHYLVDPKDGARALLEHILPCQFVGKLRTPGRTFDASGRLLSQSEAEAILESWDGSDARGDFKGVGATISELSYQRILTMAELVNAEATRKHAIPQLLAISNESIRFSGGPLVTSGGGLLGHPSVEAPLLLGARDKGLATHLTSFLEGSEEAAIAAEALNEMATLAALDHLEGLLHSKSARSGQVQYRVHRRFPVCHIRTRPRLQITVALTGAARQTPLF